MTAPTAAQLVALVQQQISEAADLEAQALDDADGGADAALTAAVTAAVAGWVAAFGSLTALGAGAALAGYLAGVRRDVTRATAGLPDRAPRAVEGALGAAATMGARHAAAFAALATGRRHRTPEAAVPDDAVQAVRGLGDLIRDHLRLSSRLLSEPQVRRSGWRGVLTGIGAARQALAAIGRVGAWALHRAVNAGAAQAIADLRAGTLWAVEPDACVTCLAYAGMLAGPDGTFPGGLSLDPRQRRPAAAPITGPPEHPRCRCRLIPWRAEWAPRRGSALPDLLREQAWQSVAAGRARPSESRAARLRAAHTLLAAPGVPAGVRRQARTAVAAGHF